MPMTLLTRCVNNPKFLKRTLFAALALIVWSLVLWRALIVLGPDSNYVSSLNSDTGIILMMANERRPVTAFSLYYYGQDRFGAWPFLIENFAGRTFNYYWTERGLYFVQTIWLFLGALMLAKLSRRRDALAVGLAFLIALCLHPIGARFIFDINQPYAWQLTALFAAWWSLRQMLAHLSVVWHTGDELAAVRLLPRLAQASSYYWSFITLVCSLLAIWMSVVSAPMLLIILFLEAWRARSMNTTERNLRSKLAHYLAWGGLPIATATLAELLMRMNYHRYSLKRYGSDYRTSFALDTGHLAENLRVQLHNFAETSGTVWLLIALLPPVIFSLRIARAWLFKHSASRRDGAHLRHVFENDDGTLLVIAAYAFATLNFAVNVLMKHVRLNIYAYRYLAPTYLFFSFSGLLTLYLILRQLKELPFKRSARVKGWIVNALLISGVAWLALLFPVENRSDVSSKVKEAAQALAGKAPHGILLGDYWSTYIFAGLERENALTPVPFEGEVNRTPWTPLMLKDAVYVEVASRRHGASGTIAHPAARIEQHGVTLRLVDPRWYDNGDYAFSTYRNEAK